MFFFITRVFKVNRETIMNAVEERMKALKSEIARLYRTPADPEEVAKETGRIIDDTDDLDKTTEEVDPIRKQVENFLTFPE